MPPKAQLSHRNNRNAALPYISNLSPTVTDPCYIPGSQNILTGINGYSQRRPGFATTVEPTPTTFNNLQRTFTWDRTDGTFYVMFCDINASNQSVVYKMQVGMDSSAVSIYTDTGSSTPFDFVVSNDTLYFSNGHVAQKWNPVIGVENWGIAIGSVNNATGPNVAGTGINDGLSNLWTNPNNITSAVSYATVTLHLAGIGVVASAAIEATNFGFSIPATTQITGIQLQFDEVLSSSSAFDFSFSSVLLKGGGQVGTPKNVLVSNTSVQTVTMGGPSDLWGTTWTPNDINQTNFGCLIVANMTQTRNLPLTNTFSARNGRITVYGIGGPSISVSGSAGTFTAVTGYQYVFCYGNSNTGHVSSPTPPSASTGAFASKLNVSISLTASTDPQVNQIRLFRSTDSVAAGTTAAVYFELPTSPYPNTTQNVTDNAADTSLIVANVAPTATFNDPPTPGQDPRYFAGRIWMQTGNKTWFSGLEEILLGVPEESWPSGVAGNFWAFDQPMQALDVAGTGNNQTLLNYCGGRIYGITGMTLDTFQRALISNRRGCRAITCTTAMGGMVAWLDSANQIWATDGSSLQEIGIQIRPDIASVNPANCSMTFHAAGTQHWLVFSTGTLLFVYDLDTEQWMPPWTFACQYIYSGETAPGQYQLMACTATKALQLSTFHNDNGTPYQPVWQTNLFAMVPDFGTRFSYVAAGIYDEPSRTGMPWWVQADTNNNPIADAQFIMDDDPLNPTSAYTSFMKDKTDVETAFNRNNGQNLIQNVWGFNQPYSRFIGLKFIGATADDTLKLYGFFIAYQVKE